ncbi:MAG: hypothetical protein HDR04_13405 [Lachnospiraceae bacterium]|nr:hypothetical protein [Lachnospiraceae bacterium]
MQKIKIINRTDGKDYTEKITAAKMIPAKCGKTGVGILVKLTRDSTGWCWKETLNNGEGHGIAGLYSTEELVFDAPQRTDEKFCCAGCGAKNFVKCSSCNQMSCWFGDRLFECAFCGHKGEVSGIIKSVGMLLDGKK